MTTGSTTDSNVTVTGSEAGMTVACCCLDAMSLTVSGSPGRFGTQVGNRARRTPSRPDFKLARAQRTGSGAVVRVHCHWHWHWQ